MSDILQKSVSHHSPPKVEKIHAICKIFNGKNFSKTIKQNATLRPIYGRALKMCYAQIERKEYAMATATIDRPPPTGEGLTFEKVWAMFQETDREIKEGHKKIERIMEENALQMKETDRKIGELSNRFGELAEHLVAPAIHERFNELGYHFNGAAEGGYVVRDDNGKILAQVDILLINNDYIMAVEVKAKPHIKDIEHHIKRLEILKKHWSKHHDKRTIQGAIAGAIFGSAEKKAVIEAGFFVLVQSGDTMKIEIPEDFVPREF